MMSVLLLFSTVLVGSVSAQAQVVEQKLVWEPQKVQTLLVKHGSHKTTSLGSLKKLEQEKKWSECAQAGATAFKANATIRGWIALSWLKCARENANDRKVVQPLVTAVQTISLQPNILMTGPWTSSLRSEMLKARMVLLDILPKVNSAEAWKQVDAILLDREGTERSHRAKAYQVAGELAQQRTQLRAALSFYESSLKEMETGSAREKMNSVLFALNESKPAEGKENILQNISEAEAKFEERFESAGKNDDLVSLVEDCVAYLKQFPNGRRAKWAQDKALETYLNFFDQSGGDRVQALREKILSLLEKSDALRQLDWARSLHRRADFMGSLRLAEKSLGTLSNTNSAAILYFIAGRSSQFLGDYKKAQKFFEKYVETSSGAEDLPEVLFRLALTHIRQDQDSSAIATLEKLLVQKNIDRYELSGRYWLVRSLQATKNPRADQEIDAILSRYPFSYYGLRLRMEKWKGSLDWPTALAVESSPKGSYYLTPGQKQIWDRIQLLSRNGWSAEALKEITEMPSPDNAQVKVLLSQKWAEAGGFPAAIRLINEAGDIDTSLRSLDVVSLSLPLVFRDAIDDQSRKQGLSPILVRSLIRQESAFGLRAVSTSNALGLMQIIPPTAAEISSELGLSRVNIPEDLFVPEVNIQMGTYYIAKMIKQFGGNVPMGLAAYNAGPTRMQIFVKARPEVQLLTKKPTSESWDELWMDEVPWFETSFYVKAILRNTMMYKLLERSAEKNPDLRRVQFGPVLWKDLVLQ